MISFRGQGGAKTARTFSAGPVANGGRAEFVITEVPRDREPSRVVLARIRDRLHAEGAQVLAAMIYASARGRAELTEALAAVFGPKPWPITWVEAGVCDGGTLAGIQVFALRDNDVSRIYHHGRPIGSVYRTGAARVCHLAGIMPDPTAATEAQAESTLICAERALRSQGFEYSDIVRTWFYNDEIVAWYRAFNEARSAHHAGRAWRSGAVPASTGIGAGNPRGAKLSLSALAVQPLTEVGCNIQEVASPGQCPAIVYGSSFSRAMEISYSGGRRLYISGTASIQPDGSTAWVGDPSKQMQLTMDVIGTILHSRRMDFGSITRATAYFKQAGFERYFDDWLARRGLEQIPVVSIEAEVCRAELLFELEVDAEA